MGWALGARLLAGSGARKFGASAVGKGMKRFGTEAAVTGAFSGAAYGAGAFMTQDPNNGLAENTAHYAKWGIAGSLDAATDVGLTLAASAMFGPMGAIAAGVGLMAAGIMGVDPGSLALEAMDGMDNMYNRMNNRGRNFQLSENSAQLMQRQIQNLQGAGSNVAEMMHN